jgi:hypothetical protein
VFGAPPPGGGPSRHFASPDAFARLGGSGGVCLFLILLLISGGSVRAGAAETRLTDLGQRGKHIYTVTTSPSGGEITAFLGISSVMAPGEAMACMNCQGPDGLGRPESDVKPGNIVWSELTKPYRVRKPGGRERPPYSEETLARAITQLAFRTH